MKNEEIQTGRYEHHDPKTDRHEFWAGEVNGVFVTISFGTVGTSGHKASKEFRTKDEAKHFLKDRLRKKEDEGFIRVE